MCQFFYEMKCDFKLFAHLEMLPNWLTTLPGMVFFLRGILLARSIGFTGNEYVVGLCCILFILTGKYACATHG
jgi:hypothetical protein